MKVNIEKDIDVERLLINLNEKSMCSSVSMASYDVTISKQMMSEKNNITKSSEVKNG